MLRTKGSWWIEQRLGQANTRIMPKSTRTEKEPTETKERMETKFSGLGLRAKNPTRGRELITAQKP